MIAPTKPADAAARRGIPPVRLWSLSEWALSCLLLAIASVAWLLTHRLATPDLCAGLLTSARPVDDMTVPPPGRRAVTRRRRDEPDVDGRHRGGRCSGKLHRHRELISRLLGVALRAAGLALLVEPATLPVMS